MQSATMSDNVPVKNKQVLEADSIELGPQQVSNKMLTWILKNDLIVNPLSVNGQPVPYDVLVIICDMSAT